MMNDIKTKEAHLDDLMPLMKECMAAGLPVKFSPKGTSMLPMIRQGIDCVEISFTTEPLKKYDIPLYQRDDGHYVLHRIVKVVSSGDTITYTCCGDNQFLYEPGIRPDQVIAVVTAFTRGEKSYTVKDLGYLIYCRFWHYSRPLRHFIRRGKEWLRRHLK
jgi:hypothetical protein